MSPTRAGQPRHPANRLHPQVASLYEATAADMSKDEAKKLALLLLVATAVVRGAGSPDEQVAVDEIYASLGRAKSRSGTQAVFSYYRREANQGGWVKRVSAVLTPGGTSRPSAGDTGRSGATTRPPCANCGMKPRRGDMSVCKECALTNDYRECMECKRLFKPPNRKSRTAKCHACRGGSRRKPPSGTSVRTVSGGLPSLGKH